MPLGDKVKDLALAVGERREGLGWGTPLRKGGPIARLKGWGVLGR